MGEFKLNKKKALNALLFICHKRGGSSDMYNLLKTVFFADSKHLFNYGRPITGDTMYSFQFGPLPTFCYDAVKADRFDKSLFNVESDVVEAIAQPDLDVFSESDLECLEESIKELSPMPFPDLLHKSHTPSYEKTVKEKGLRKPMSFIDIAKEDGKVNDEMLKYITSRFQY